VLESRGKYAEAEGLLQRVLSIYMQANPRNPRDIAVTLNNLGTLAASRKRYPQATALFRQSLDILQTSVPATHPDQGEVMANLADMLKREGQMDESAELYQRGLEILSQALGPDSPRLLRWLDAYAAVLHAKEEFGEAEKVRLQATRIRVTRTLRKAS